MAEADVKGAQIRPDVPQKPEPRFFEFGDVCFECNRCGNFEVISKGVKDGMQFVLPTSDQHEWRLVCGKCKNMMRIFYIESSPETIEEAKAEIAKKEAEEKALEEAKKEAKDEPKKKNKKGKSTKGSPKDNAGTDKLDGEGDAVATPTDQSGPELG